MSKVMANGLNTAQQAEANLLLTHNPFVYKGYFYDSETGYYYLKSRYYDPRIHRFLSVDKIDYLDPKSLSSLNLYVYCGDNPVMGYDPSGCVWWNPFSWSAETWGKIGLIVLSAATLIVGTALILTGAGSPLGMALIGAGSGSLINGFMNEAAGGSFWAGWLGGAISGALTNLLPGTGIIGGFVGSAVTDLIDKGWNNIDWKKAVVAAAFSWALDLLPTTIGLGFKDELSKSIVMKLILSSRGTLVSVGAGAINFYDSRKR